MSDDLIIQSLTRIEQNQKDHADKTYLRLQSIEQTCAVLVSQQASDDKALEKLDERVGETEKKLWQYGGVITFLSVTGAAIADKLLGGGQ